MNAAENAPPDLTAIVIGFDVREELLACLESLRRHSGDLSVEVIFVDNGSRDGSAEAVGHAFPETEVIRIDENIGVPARNLGLRRARGRHRMFLDSDAAVTAGALETLVALLDENPGIGLAGPRLVNLDGSPQLSARRYPPLLLPLLRRPPLRRWLGDSRWVRRHLMADDPPECRRRVEYVLGACQVFRAEAQAAVGEIDERIWYGPDDADWCLRVRRAGFDVVYAPESVVVHGYRRSSASRPVSRLALRHMTAFWYFQWKWRRERRALIQEGREMDGEARRAIPARA